MRGKIAKKVLKRLLIVIAAGVLFKRQGRNDEHLDPESKGSSKSPKCYPPVGSVVYRNMRLVEHSGVYVGHGLIVSKAKSGKVKKKELHKFLGSHRSLFVSAGSSLAPFGKPEIAHRALKAAGKSYNHGLNRSCDDGMYEPILNNCHIFTSYCITGETNGDTGLSHLKSTAKQHGMKKWIKWRFDS